MNKTAIKNYAIWARVQLIEAAKQRAYEYEITDGGENKPGLETIGGRLLSKTEKEQRNQLITEINRKGFAQVMEEAAYTWFNRFIALRFMEVNGYLPSKVRVFTDENGAFKPEILKQAISVELEGLDRNKVLDLLDKQNNEELYKCLLIAQCNALNSGLPYMFEKIGGWTELLFPANLLHHDSVIGQMISEIPEEDWTDAVQIIGWMYQYYNSELKDETFALLKKNVKITKERIPAATQLFTPDWIVRYMVENSLGRLWYEGHPDFDKSQWKYYLDEAEQEPEVETKLQKIRAEYAAIKPEEIKVIDPCMGSGHILVYAFDVLMQIYTSAGWSERDAVKSILENNLYGLDIDDRAGQLAYFAVMMKARKHSRRILNGEVKLKVLSIQDSNWMTDEFIAYVAEKDADMKADLTMIRKTFRDAKEYGSILNVPAMKYDAIYERIDIINRSYAENLFQAQYIMMATEQLRSLVKQSQIMSQQYDVVVTNPPYMGSSGMSARLATFVKEKYPDSKSDLFAVFMERCGDYSRPGRYQAMITQHAWMFLACYEDLRKKVLAKILVNMVHLGARAFEEIAGEVVQTTAFVLRNYSEEYFSSLYCRLVDQNSEQGKRLSFFDEKNRYVRRNHLFSKIPGTPLAYWKSTAFLELFSNLNLGSYLFSDGQILTGNNAKYLRAIWEVSNIKIQNKEWKLHTKGGAFRKWYGNIDTVVDWSTTAIEHYKKDPTARILSEKYWDNTGIVWNGTCDPNRFGARILQAQESFNKAAPGVFLKDSRDKEYYYLGLINSVVGSDIMTAFNSSLYRSVADVLKIPVIKDNVQVVSELVKQCIECAKEDWDSFEVSWDFKRHPLIPSVPCISKSDVSDRKEEILIEEKYQSWERETTARFERVHRNEEELNRIFINMYAMQDELIPSVSSSNVTIRKADLKRDIKSLISYSVGCMFGRYSLDADGVCYAGNAKWDSSLYKTFIPDCDNIIPICDDEYFNDDIVDKFITFVGAVYGKGTLEPNLRFIAEALGGKGSARKVIRQYFINDFFSDHCNTYSVIGSGKRPIYWLFSSGKKNGFKALVYMHRYQPDLLARIRTDYIHEQQERYRTQIQLLEGMVRGASSSEKAKLNQQMFKLKDQASEIQLYEEKIHHLADQMININLDDGVKANYSKFQEVLERI